jgi:hypothetical protein
MAENNNMDWTEGDWVVRREVLSNGPWLGSIVKIIEDSPEHLISYIPEGSPFSFPDGDWPIPDGKHPWSGRQSWQGHGCLMIQKPENAYAIWHFWSGSKREFLCWYINLQEPFRRSAIGYDTQDLELDLVVYPDGRWELKDDELMDQRAVEGRWTEERVAEIRADAAKIAGRLETGERWWPSQWRDWKPDPSWVVPSDLPVGWETV